MSRDKPSQGRPRVVDCGFACFEVLLDKADFLLKIFGDSNEPDASRKTHYRDGAGASVGQESAGQP